MIDIQMRHVNGDDVCRQLAAKGFSVPIIAMTGTMAVNSVVVRVVLGLTACHFISSWCRSVELLGVAWRWRMNRVCGCAHTLGNSSDAEVSSYLALGFQAVLTKPFQLEDVASVLEPVPRRVYV